MNNLHKLKQRQGVIFDSMASLMASMASPVRIKLIHFLSQAPLTVEVLATKLDQTVANTSMHLRKMLVEGLVTTETLGQKRLYTLVAPVLEFWEVYQDFYQQLNPLEKMSEEFNWNEDWVETHKLIKNKKAILLDVRPVDEALSKNINSHNILQIPFENLKSNIDKLSKKQTIIVFCRGRMCALSTHTVNFLRENGFKAYRLKESWTRLSKNML